jgi:norsolorinic acid ketoreductase
MGNHGANHFGLGEAPDTIEETTAGMVDVIDKATRESTSGHFAGWNGKEFPW